MSRTRTGKNTRETAAPIPRRKAPSAIVYERCGKISVRPGRAALGEDVDELEVRGGPDRGEHHRRQEDRAEPRDGDVEELLDDRGAVDLGGLVELLGNRLEPRQERHGVEGRARPDHDRDDAAHGEVRIGEPGDDVLRDVEGDQEVVEEAGEVVEDPPPVQGHDDDGYRPGNEEERPEDVVEAPLLVEDERHRQAEHELDGDGDDGVDDAVVHRPEEEVAPEQIDVVLEPDEAPGGADHLALERQVDADEERIGDQPENDEEGRGQDRVGESRLAPRPEPRAARARPSPSGDEDRLPIGVCRVGANRHRASFQSVPGSRRQCRQEVRVG